MCIRDSLAMMSRRGCRCRRRGMPALRDVCLRRNILERHRRRPGFFFRPPRATTLRQSRGCDRRKNFVEISPTSTASVFPRFVSTTKEHSRFSFINSFVLRVRFFSNELYFGVRGRNREITYTYRAEPKQRFSVVGL